MTYIESIRGYPYMPKQQLAEEFHVSKSTVFARLKEIETEIQGGRYSDYAIINDGNIVLVNVLVFIDYLTYRQKLRGKNTRKYVPAFNPAEITKIIGWENRPVRIEEA
ncbi:MAG: hypothetical protein Q4C77_16260 [Eubacteriales bacterium]|nr:hypothetical protein [Eubacteriales bacterium]